MAAGQDNLRQIRWRHWHDAERDATTAVPTGFDLQDDLIAIDDWFRHW